MERNNCLNQKEARLRRSFLRLTSFTFSRVSLSLLLIFAIFSSTLAPFVFGARNSGVKPARNATQTGETTSFYGPRRFERLSGTPVTVTEQFLIPNGVIAPYTISIQNGGSNGVERVSSAVIRLNGVELFSNQIKDTVPSLSQTVALQSVNTLEVRLTSTVGSFLFITFTGIRTVLPAASLLSVNPARANQGQTLSVTLTGQNTHWVAGQTRASFGPEVSVGGAPAGELGPVSVTNLTTAVAQISVSGTAALSPRLVRVVTPNVPAPFPLNLIEESVSLLDGFTVVASTPPSPSSTNVTTIAGLAGDPGFVDGRASQARFQNPTAVAVGPADSLVVADSGNHRIRLVRSELDQSGNSQSGVSTPLWVVSTLAGNGTEGFADGPALMAQFKNPQGVAVDANGIVFVADTGNNRIRKISLDGNVTTVAGDGVAGLLDGAGTQARFNGPRGLAVDQQGNIYVADSGNAAVRLIAPNGQVSTLAGDGTVGANDSPNARFDGLSGIAVDGSDIYVYIADAGNHRIRRLDATGVVVTVAGSDRGFADGSVAQARFAEPSGIAFDASGKLLVTDSVNSLIRQVDPQFAANGSLGAVTTVAGSGERGQIDGPGSLARFLNPRGLAVTASSAIVVADTGNHTLRRLTLPPSISSISPATARPAETVTINGERFDARGPERNTVRFTRAIELGGGQITAAVAAATRTSLVVVVPDDAATGPVTVETEGGTAVSPTPFEVLPPIPVINDFNPKAGTVGTTVSLTGEWLKAHNGDPVVTFAGRGDLRLPALVTFASRTQVNVMVPNAAVTGPIELTNVWGKTSTAQPFTVEASQDFQIAVAPSSVTAVQRSSATYVITLTSLNPSFTQLARLSVTGLPAGVDAVFDSPQITAGASSTLTLNLSNANVAPGSYDFTISAAAPVDGNEFVRTVHANLSVLAAGETTLSGRVMSTEAEPIIGATVSLDGRSATTDAAGSFLLTGITAGVDRPVVIDGRTASAPNRTYPVLAEPATVVAGQANAVPYIFYLPAIDVEFEVILVPGQTAEIGTPRIPGFKLTVPADANLHNRDNTPVTRVSITPVPIDRTPTPLPSNVTAALVYTNQPGGAIADSPMPVVYPNLSGSEPGTRAYLYAFNHDTVKWYVYGYGRVSPDGRTIEPEIDPATGKPYGLTDFSWHFPSTTPDGDPGDCDCPSNRTDDPVDLSTGTTVEVMSDVWFGGQRGKLALTRVFTTNLFDKVGRFGRGVKDNFDIKLTGTFDSGGAGRIVSPEESTGTLYSYARTDADGAQVFESIGKVSHLGSAVRRLANGTFEFRSANGQVARFDSERRLAAMVDRNGNTTTLTYTGSRLTSVTDPVGRSINFDYNSSGLVERVTDPLGREWRYTYSPAGETFGGTPSGSKLRTVTDPLDNVIQYNYEGLHLVEIKDGRGNVAKRISYDNITDRVSEQTFPDGGFERYSYQTSGTIVTAVSITDSLGRTESKRFNAAGYVIGMLDALGQRTALTRDIQTNVKLSVLGSCCGSSTHKYDVRGNLIELTDKLNQTSRWEYEPKFNNVIRAIDRLGRETTFGYDERGNLTSVQHEQKPIMTLTYDQFGQLESIKDPLNHTTSAEYDGEGNRIAIVDGLNHRTEFEYDEIGRLRASEDPEGRRGSLTLDRLGRVETMTIPSQAVTQLTYDANDNLTSLTNHLGHRWQWIYDEKDRVKTKIDPLNRSVHFRYNTDDELLEVKTPLGRTYLYDYDARGQLVTRIDPQGNLERLTYDSEGNVVSLADRRGNTTSFTYDELGRRTSQRNPLGQFFDFGYDAEGNITSYTDRFGRPTTILRDEMHRPSRITYPDATVDFTFDPAGRLTRIDDSQSGFVQWAFDDANRLQSETTPNGTVTYAYNDANQRVSMTADGALPVSYGYDTAGRLETISAGADTFTYAYDSLSRLTSLQRPNGITTTYAYDKGNRLTRLTHKNALDQLIEDYRYTRTSDGQISSITSLGPAQSLPQEKSGPPANAANRLAQFGSASYTFDQRGQTITKSDEQGPTTYQWDARGRLTGASLPDGQTVSYGYDVLGRRTSRTAGGVTTRFLYDGPDIVRDRAGDDEVHYLNGPTVDNKLRQTSSQTGALYFISDHLGSTRTLTNAGGGVVELLQYEAFGVSTGSSFTRYGYTGREHDSLTGLIYYRSRWYDPNQGRFINEDPTGFASGDSNFYAYVSNDPIHFVDPTGLDGEGFGTDSPIGQGDGLIDLINSPEFRKDEGFWRNGFRGIKYALEYGGNFFEGADWLRGAIAFFENDEEGMQQAAMASVPILGCAAFRVGSKIKKVNKRMPKNAGEWAGKTHPSGVKFSDEGFPDFSPWAAAKVKVKGLNGHYKHDEALSNAAAGLPETPNGYVWHHVEDCKTMLLVPKSIHNPLGHTGGAARIKAGECP